MNEAVNNVVDNEAMEAAVEAVAGAGFVQGYTSVVFVTGILVGAVALKGIQIGRKIWKEHKAAKLDAEIEAAEPEIVVNPTVDAEADNN